MSGTPAVRPLLVAAAMTMGLANACVAAAPPVSPGASPSPTGAGSQLPSPGLETPSVPTPGDAWQGRIAVVVDGPDGSEIHVLAAGTEEPTTVIPAAESPAWSPDGGRLAYVCRYAPDQMPGLCLIDVLDSAPSMAFVLPDVLSVTWSPVADLLLIGRSPIDLGDTYLATPAGTDLAALTVAGAETRVDRWSRDGTLAAGISAAGGAGPSLVTVCQVADLRCRAVGRGLPLAWSPDGRRVAVAGGAAPLLALDVASGSTSVLLADGPPVVGADWSRDGRLAVVREGGSLVIVDTPGGDPVPLGGDLRFAGQPAWSPDSAWIAVRAEEGALSALFVMRADGSARARLTPSGRVTAASWDPAG